MEIKNGPPLIISWLRDIKKCQITQPNWFVSSHSWELQNIDIIEEVISSVQNFFHERYNYNIFKGNRTPMQFLNQGEIDILGFEIKSGTIANIYGVNTLFVPNSFKKYDSITSVEIVINNMIRTAMLIHGYYHLSRGSIILTASDLPISIVDQLDESVKALNEIFKLFGFDFVFILYVNEEYEHQILNPIASLERDTKNIRSIPKIDSIIGQEFAQRGLKEYLEISGYEVIDKREKGGALWLIGGQELEPFMLKLSSKYVVKFVFTEKGSKSTKNKPAWFTKAKI